MEVNASWIAATSAMRKRLVIAVKPDRRDVVNVPPRGFLSFQCCCFGAPPIAEMCERTTKAYHSMCSLSEVLPRLTGECDGACWLLGVSVRMP